MLAGITAAPRLAGSLFVVPAVWGLSHLVKEIGEQVDLRHLLAFLLAITSKMQGIFLKGKIYHQSPFIKLIEDTALGQPWRLS